MRLLYTSVYMQNAGKSVQFTDSPYLTSMEVSVNFPAVEEDKRTPDTNEEDD